MNIHGILNLCKPTGLTSFHVVQQVRRLSGQRKVGHAGTLDPLASGVLVVCLGHATRLVPYLMGHHKVYLAEITLGATTDTYDAEGRITSQASWSHVTREMIDEALSHFVGRIQQRPPAYSAVKQRGSPLYRLARAGAVVEPPLRVVTMYHVELCAWQPPVLKVLVECSSGTYIRSLAHDLGDVLRCGAFLSDLVRVRSGPFCLEDSVRLEELVDAFTRDYWHRLLYPVDIPLLHWPAMILGHERLRRVRNGIPLPMHSTCSAQAGNPEEGRRLVRGYSVDGELLALLEPDTSAGLWRVVRVFQGSEG